MIRITIALGVGKTKLDNPRMGTIASQMSKIANENKAAADLSKKLLAQKDFFAFGIYRFLRAKDGGVPPHILHLDLVAEKTIGKESINRLYDLGLSARIDQLQRLANHLGIDPAKRAALNLGNSIHRGLHLFVKYR